MKLHFLVLAAISIVASAGLADSENGGSVETDAPRQSSSPERAVRRVIPQAGIIFSEYRGSDNQVYFGRTGYSVGGLLDLFGTRKLVLESGLLYRETGATAGSSNYTVRHLSVPATAKYYFNGQENTSLYIKGGAVASNLLGSDTSQNYNGSAVRFNRDQWDLDALAGLGMKIYISPAADLLLEATYQRPWNSVFARGNDYSYSALAANAGIGINL